jgi:hypothetical protein
MSMEPGAHIVMFVWIALTLAIAFVILRVTIAVFDRLLGRTPALRTVLLPDPRPKLLSTRRVRQT